MASCILRVGHRTSRAIKPTASTTVRQPPGFSWLIAGRGHIRRDEIGPEGRVGQELFFAWSSITRGLLGGSLPPGRSISGRIARPSLGPGGLAIAHPQDARCTIPDCTIPD